MTHIELEHYLRKYETMISMATPFHVLAEDTHMIVQQENENMYINRYLLKGCFLPIVQCPPMAPVALEKLEPARGSRVWCSWGERSSGAVPPHCLRKNVTPGLRCVVTPWRRDARCRDARRRDNSPSVENGWSALPVRLLGVRNYVNFILLTKWEVSKKFFLYCAWFFYLLIVAGDQRKGVKGRK